MNSETFALPRDAPEIVGTCRLDTYRFIINSFGKTILILKILIFSICSRTNHKNIFPEKYQNSKNPKYIDFSNFSKFDIFWKNIFCFCSRTYRKNQNFQNQNSFFVLFALCPRGVKFSSPRTGSKAVRGVSEKKSNFFPQNFHSGGVSFVIRLSDVRKC